MRVRNKGIRTEGGATTHLHEGSQKTRPATNGKRKFDKENLQATQATLSHKCHKQMSTVSGLVPEWCDSIPTLHSTRKKNTGMMASVLKLTPGSLNGIEDDGDWFATPDCEYGQSADMSVSEGYGIANSSDDDGRAVIPLHHGPILPAGIMVSKCSTQISIPLTTLLLLYSTRPFLCKPIQHLGTAPYARVRNSQMTIYLAPRAQSPPGRRFSCRCGLNTWVHSTTLGITLTF